VSKKGHGGPGYGRNLRGSFAGDFHRSCDGHANTVTIIEDTDWNIFGGFTPRVWDSRGWKVGKADPSLKSFIFTLNWHNVPAQRFALKTEQKDSGSSYTYDTGLNGKTFFAGSVIFQVKEIEIGERSSQEIKLSVRFNWLVRLNKE
jgi:hypothetical protein